MCSSSSPNKQSSWPTREAGGETVTFAEPPEDAVRAAANPVWVRWNPLVSWQKDGDYAVTRLLGGLVWRQDQNRVGTAHRFLLGCLGTSRQTTSFDQWALGGGWLARHESEARRGVRKSTLLPWGVLWSHSSAAQPQSPTNTLATTRVLWGLAGSGRSLANGERTLRLLPGGLLYRSTASAERTAVHLLGTGVSHRHNQDQSEMTMRYRLLGLPIWTTHAKVTEVAHEELPVPGGLAQGP